MWPAANVRMHYPLASGTESDTWAASGVLNLIEVSSRHVLRLCSESASRSREGMLTDNRAEHSADSSVAVARTIPISLLFSDINHV
jgi:hypothetical protein